MTELNHHLRPIKEALAKTYNVPFYQRGYKWERKQFEDLLNDLQEEFLNHFDEKHGRDKVAQYKSYFLGTILTTTDQETSRKIIIDGQQRLTSLTLFFIYALQQRKLHPELHVTDFTGLIKTESYGKVVLNFESDSNRSKLINILTEKETGVDNGEFDFLENADSGTNNIYQRFQDIDDILDDEIKNHYFSYFSDWIAEKVVLFEIVVPSEHDAHKVFVAMNDRGVNLTPSEMLKGFLLSRITNPQKHKEAHSLWQDKIRELKKDDNEEDANFIRNWLRAKYANSIRRKKAGEGKKDFESIGDSYHRWLHENRNQVGLKNHDDYQSFILEKFKKYVDLYLRIQKYSSEFTEGYEYVFYNASKNITLQSMLILSAIKLDDTDSIVERKIALVSKYIDYYTTLRILNLKKNTYDNLRDIFFNLTKEIRDKDEKELKKILLNHSESLEYSFSAIDKFTYKAQAKKNMLHVLARIASYLEEGTQQTNSVGFATYIDRKCGGRTYDIEHVLANTYKVFVDSNEKREQDFSSEAEYKSERDKLGGLLLLPRSRNRSLKDKPFSAKVSKYTSENILAQSLNKDFYENNPQVERFVEGGKISLKPYTVFNKKTLYERHQLYKTIANEIWSIEAITS
ncbi:MAG: DUF262 domain-containing protein [Candidatus Electrothrix sp. AR5]|nr:DUF262 domain-containing protein [Candidatus Electrothrix sp. AR5]